MIEDAKNQATQFSEIVKQLDGIYENYAKSIGLSYTSLYVFHKVSMREDCMQKELCEQLFLPKQTINSIVMSFQKQGLMEMVALPEDRRHKTIHLTAKGKEYAKQILPKIEAAEINSMEQFDPERRNLLLQLMEQYVHFFTKELQK